MESATLHSQPATHALMPAALLGAPESTEARLARRYGRSPAQEEVTYEFTDDKALLHQYYRLRVERYRQTNGFVDFNDRADEYDRISHILIARKGKLCVGGARLTVREPDETWALPMERNGFVLRNSLDEIPLHNHIHAEVGRFAIQEDYNTLELLSHLSLELNRKADELHIVYGFCRSFMPLARNWRKINNNIGIYQADIRVIENPLFHIEGEAAMYLTMLKSQRIATQAHDAPALINAVSVLH